jgi:hypothetical protein
MYPGAGRTSLDGMEIPEELRDAATGATPRHLNAWRRPADGVDLAEVDSDLLDLVLCLDRELRGTAVLAALSRRRGVTYPVKDVEELADALADTRLQLGEHVVDTERLRRAMREERFPLWHEGELLEAIHRSLLWCRLEASIRRHAALDFGSLNVEPREPSSSTGPWRD